MKPLSQHARVVLSVLALLGLAVACETTGSGLGPAPQSDAQRLRADVAWLADDAQEGRRAGTEAGRRAADWLVARFADLGLEAELQRFEVPLPIEDGGWSSVGLGLRRPWVGPEHLVPLFCSNGAEARGPLAWRGYGIVQPELGWNDYADPADEGTGAVVLLVRGAPVLGVDAVALQDSPADSDLVHSGDGWGNSATIFSKVMTAKRNGAVAVLIAPHPDQAGEPLLAFDASRSAQASIPALSVSLEVARALVPDYDARVRAIDSGGASAVSANAPEAVRVQVLADVRRGKGPAFNVFARVPGLDRGRAVVVGAHYDHLGFGGDGSLAPEATGQIHNGADDNASGTAAVLELARRLLSGPPPACDVVCALWSGEELGLLGSEHWAKEPTFPLETVVANINLDMVGRAGDGKLTVLGAGTAAPFADWLAEAGPAAGLALDVSLSGQGVGGSDHQTFLKRQVPALHFFSGVHTDYHKPSDDIERFEAQGTARVVDLALDLVRRMAAAGELSFVEVAAPEGDQAQRLGAGWRVWFGTVPEYGYEGTGLLLSGTSSGSPAESAGLLAGDVILQVGEVEVVNIYDFMHALQTYKPGDVVLTRFERDGEPQEVRVTLRTREVE